MKKPKGGDEAAAEAGRATIERQIDANLRRVYQQALAEEVPDRLVELLARLKEQGGAK